MKKTAWILIAALAAPSVAQADTKRIIGWTSIAVGSGMVIGAWNYDSSCPSGYSTHTINTTQVHDTTCVTVSRYGSDVRDPDVSAEFARPNLLWAGIGTAAFGAVMLLLPSRAQKVVPSINVTPKSATASKTIRW